jgi:hypothetical protein
MVDWTMRAARSHSASPSVIAVVSTIRTRKPPRCSWRGAGKALHEGREIFRVGIKAVCRHFAYQVPTNSISTREFTPAPLIRFHRLLRTCGCSFPGAAQWDAMLQPHRGSIFAIA